MITHNKPKLKIIFQTKNKVYLNKNSKFRFFYLLRSRFFKSRESKHRRFLCVRNMKWTVARRFFCTRAKTRQNLRFSYLNKLQNKQQLKRFYGNLREKKLIKILKAAWMSQSQYKQVIFLKNLESRLSILLLRMRVLPTIFACNQFILHKGVYVNNDKIFLPNYQIKVGDIISFDKEIWEIFYRRLNGKVINRYRGTIRLVKRNLTKKNRIAHKLVKYQRNRKRENLIYIGEIEKFQVKLNQLNKILLSKSFLNKFIKTGKSKVLFILKKKLDFLNNKIERLRNSLIMLRKWRISAYYKGELYIILNYLFIDYLFKKLNLFLWKCFFNKSYGLNSKTYLNLVIKRTLAGTYLPKNKKYLYKNKYYKNITQRQSYNLWWQKQPHWYIPLNLEIDYTTLRLSLIGNPQLNNISYPFNCSLYKISSFYTDKGYK